MKFGIIDFFIGTKEEFTFYKSINLLKNDHKYSDYVFIKEEIYELPKGFFCENATGIFKYYRKILNKDGSRWKIAIITGKINYPDRLVLRHDNKEAEIVFLKQIINGQEIIKIKGKEYFLPLKLNKNNYSMMWKPINLNGEIALSSYAYNEIIILKEKMV
jgi:hypothetical protein